MAKYDIFAEVGIVIYAKNKREAKERLYKLLNKFNIHNYEIETKKKKR